VQPTLANGQTPLAGQYEAVSPGAPYVVQQIGWLLAVLAVWAPVGNVRCKFSGWRWASGFRVFVRVRRLMRPV